MLVLVTGVEGEPGDEISLLVHPIGFEGKLIY